MANVRTKLLLIGALLVGLVCALMIVYSLKRRVPNEPIPMLVAAETLKAGTRLTIKDIKLLKLSADRMPKGAFQDVRALDGRVLARDIAREEAFTDDALTPLGATTGLASVIVPGMRAMTVRVNDVVGVAGFALPGNYVDIIVNIAASRLTGIAEKNISKIVLEKVLVLAVAQQTNRDENAPKVVNAVTLQVTPEQAEKIDLARNVGSLSLVLRNQLDHQSEQTKGATHTTLLGAAPEQTPARAPAKPLINRNCAPVIAGARVKSDCW